MEKEKLKIVLVVGARPNFMKIAPIIRQLRKNNIDYELIHTGQHYDKNMSDVFFKELNIPRPHINLSVGSNSHAKQTAEIMTLFENYCINKKPNIVVVVGDVNSTVACALVVSKIKDIKLAHIEAGLRSFDRGMPEEVNRVVTDILSDYLFCTIQKAVDNLLKENVKLEKIHLVGDVLIDNLIYNLSKIDDFITKKKHILLTLHRPSNTDVKQNLINILEAVGKISKKIKVVFPIHPRTKKQITFFGLDSLLQDISCCDPLSYLEFLRYMRDAHMILTDSGGIQPEAYFLGTPCITLRNTTEHVFTLAGGANVLVGSNKSKLLNEFDRLYNDPNFSVIENELSDGKVAKRIVSILIGGTK